MGFSYLCIDPPHPIPHIHHFLASVAAQGAASSGDKPPGGARPAAHEGAKDVQVGPLVRSLASRGGGVQRMGRVRNRCAGEVRELGNVIF